MSRESGQRFNTLDKLQVATAWGVGHAGCHVIFFFASLLPLTQGDGTYYTEHCPRMSIFLIDALYCIAFFMILTSAMVVFMDGCMTSKWLHIAFAPAVHTGAALLVGGADRALGRLAVHTGAALLVGGADRALGGLAVHTGAALLVGGADRALGG